MNKPAISYEQHPLSLRLVPSTMPDNEFLAFSEDLLKRGQQHPIILFEGKILDGWHRYTGLTKNGQTPVFKEYEGDDPAGLVIALNVLRRKLGTTQRALAGAVLNIDYKISQDEAAKRVGVSKLHINLVVQAMNSKNARVIKLLENPDLTREALYEELVDCGIVPGNAAHTRDATPPSHLSEAGAFVGLNSIFASRPEEDDDLLGDGETDGPPELDDILGDPPSAGGRVIASKSTSGDGNSVVGTRVQHPERRNKDTPAYLLAEKFRALTEADRISFVQLTWHAYEPLLAVAGVAAKAKTAAAPATPHVPSKSTSAQQKREAAKVALQAIDKAANAAAGAPAEKPAQAPAKAKVRGKASPGVKTA